MYLAIKKLEKLMVLNANLGSIIIKNLAVKFHEKPEYLANYEKVLEALDEMGQESLQISELI